MSKFPFLSMMKSSSLMSLIYKLKIKNYIKDDIFYKENDSVEYLYLVYKGSVEIS